MHILHISPLYLPHVGGVEVLLRGLTHVQQDRGHDVMILCSTARPDEASGEVEGVTVVRVPFNEALRNRDPGVMLQARQEVAHAVSEYQPDVLHAHDVGPFTWFYRQATRDRNEPMIFTVHTLTDRLGGSKASFAAMLRGSNWVTGVSSAVKQQVLDLEPSVSDRFSIVTNGVDQPGRPATPVQQNPRSLVVVGRLVQDKRVDLAVRALARLPERHADVRLVIIGRGHKRAELESLAAELGVTERIDFTGLVDRAALWEHLEQATLVIAPSDVEGLSLAVLEAAWAGRPAVGTIGTGLSDAIADGETGVLVPRGDLDALTNAISDLLDDPERLQTLGTAARARAEREFSLEVCADRYEALYEWVLGQEPASERV